MSDEMKVMVPDERTVKIGNETFQVRPFSVKDVVYFTREIIDGLKSMKTKYPELDFDKADMMKCLPLLLDEVPRLFNLIARSINKDSEWLQNNTDLVGVSNLFSIVTEINDFGSIIANFRSGWSNLAKQTIRASAVR